MPPERLAGYLAELHELLRDHAMGGVTYGHFGEGCIHLRVGFGLDKPGGRERFRALHGGGRGPRRRATAARCPASTATAGRGAPCWTGCIPPAILEAFGRFKAIWDPQGPAQPGHHRGSRARGRRPALDGPDAHPDDARARLPPRPRRPAGGREPLHRGGTLRQPAGERADVPQLPRDGPRAGLHPRPGADAPGDDGRVARRAGLATPGRCSTRWTCACPARAASRSAPRAWTWRATSRSSSHHHYAGPAAGPCPTISLGQLPRWLRLGWRMAPAGQRDAAHARHPGCPDAHGRDLPGASHPAHRASSVRGRASR